MKRGFSVIAAVILCCCAAAPFVSAQTATFIYNDNNGVPNVGSYHPGDSFTFSLNLAFTPGGNVANLVGLSYWFEQSNPNPPYDFSITNRNVTGSQFTFLQTPGLSYPQTLAASNPKDLGGSTQSGTGVGAGTYLISNVTVTIDPNTPLGDYFIEDVTSGGRRSVISDDQAHLAGIALAQYEIDVVPEPATWVAGGLVVAALGSRFVHRKISRVS